MNFIKKEKVGAIIVGAGLSKRFGSDKLRLQLSGKPLLAWAVDTCQSSVLIDKIVLVLNINNQEYGKKLIDIRKWTKVTDICAGGVRRQDSVYEGLKYLHDCKWIIIHDAARPFLTDELIDKGFTVAKESGSAIAAVPVKSTIKLSDKNLFIKETLQRDYLWEVQTPQIFRFDIINDAFDKITETVTDEASMVEKLGYKIKLYMGSYSNIKITTIEDWPLAKIIASGKGKK